MSRPKRPTVSAVLIVKDEETVLDSCLSSVSWADEVVVYDTGSTDSTVEVARRHADVVIEGFWDDDFGAARNRSLQHATGDWILTIDADEVFTGDAEAFRKRLGHGGATMHTILQTNVHPITSGPVDDSPALRIFRRDRHRWRGQLHEQLEPLPEAPPFRPVLLPMPNARLMHTGYRADVIGSKEKASRNLTIAERDLEAAILRGESRTDVGVLRSNYARSLALAGRKAEALEVAEALYRSGDAPELTVVTLSRTFALVAHEIGDLAASDRWFDRWVLAERNPAWAYARKAQLAAHRGDASAALEALAHVPTTTVNETQQRLDRAQLAPVEVWALAVQERWGQAVEVAWAATRAGQCPGDPAALLLVFERAGRDLLELLREMPEQSWQAVALLAANAPWNVAGPFLASMREVRPADLTVLTCAAAQAGRMSIEEAMEWSLPIRTAGLADMCPLLVIAATPGLDPRQRSVAAAVAFEAYEDQRVLPHLQAALGDVPAEHEVELLQLLEAASPGLVANG